MTYLGLLSSFGDQEFESAIQRVDAVPSVFVSPERMASMFVLRPLRKNHFPHFVGLRMKLDNTCCTLFSNAEL